MGNETIFSDLSQLTVTMGAVKPETRIIRDVDLKKNRLISYCLLKNDLYIEMCCY